MILYDLLKWKKGPPVFEEQDEIKHAVQCTWFPTSNNLLSVNSYSSNDAVICRWPSEVIFIQNFSRSQLMKNLLWYSNVSYPLTESIPWATFIQNKKFLWFQRICEWVAPWPWPALAQWTWRGPSTHPSSTSRRSRALLPCWRIYLWCSIPSDTFVNVFIAF